MWRFGVHTQRAVHTYYGRVSSKYKLFYFHKIMFPLASVCVEIPGVYSHIPGLFFQLFLAKQKRAPGGKYLARHEQWPKLVATINQLHGHKTGSRRSLKQEENRFKTSGKKNWTTRYSSEVSKWLTRTTYLSTRRFSERSRPMGVEKNHRYVWQYIDRSCVLNLPLFRGRAKSICIAQIRHSKYVLVISIPGTLNSTR